MVVMSVNDVVAPTSAAEVPPHGAGRRVVLRSHRPREAEHPHTILAGAVRGLAQDVVREDVDPIAETGESGREAGDVPLDTADRWWVAGGDQGNAADQGLLGAHPQGSIERHLAIAPAAIRPFTEHAARVA